MTVLEKYIQDHPDISRNHIISDLCPSDEGYVNITLSECDATSDCDQCWNREYEE